MKRRNSGNKKPVAAALLFLLGLPAAAAPSRLLDLYKTGRVVIEPDSAFGKSVDWGSFFFDNRQDMAVGPDGSIFVANTMENCILKFDAAGRLVKKFGQKGQGPGDLISPMDLSILDGRFLVSNELATNRRISLFNLDGTFHKLLKTRSPNSNVTALRDNKIARESWVSVAPGTKTTQMTYLVMILDAVSGTEKEIARWTTAMDFIQVGQGSVYSGERTLGGFLIARSAQGNLLVGNTIIPRLDEYSPEGQKVRSLDLNLTPVPVTKQYIGDYHRLMVRGMKSKPDYEKSPQYRDVVAKVESASIDHIFGEFLPLYKEILVDSEGNILVFKKSECLENCPNIFQVYSPEGKYVCEAELASEDFDVSIDHRFKRISFTSGGIFCLFPLRGDELQTPRLVKVAVAAPGKKLA